MLGSFVSTRTESAGGYSPPRLFDKLGLGHDFYAEENWADGWGEDGGAEVVRGVQASFSQGFLDPSGKFMMYKDTSLESFKRDAERKAATAQRRAQQLAARQAALLKLVQKKEQELLRPQRRRSDAPVRQARQKGPSGADRAHRRRRSDAPVRGHRRRHTATPAVHLLSSQSRVEAMKMRSAAVTLQANTRRMIYQRQYTKSRKAAVTIQTSARQTILHPTRVQALQTTRQWFIERAQIRSAKAELGRRRADMARMRADAEADLRNQAATHIQAVARGMLTRLWLEGRDMEGAHAQLYQADWRAVRTQTRQDHGDVINPELGRWLVSEQIQPRTTLEAAAKAGGLPARPVRESLPLAKSTLRAPTDFSAFGGGDGGGGAEAAAAAAAAGVEMETGLLPEPEAETAVASVPVAVEVSGGVTPTAATNGVTSSSSGGSSISVSPTTGQDTTAVVTATSVSSPTTSAALRTDVATSDTSNAETAAATDTAAPTAVGANPTPTTTTTALSLSKPSVHVSEDGTEVRVYTLPSSVGSAKPGMLSPGYARPAITITSPAHGGKPVIGIQSPIRHRSPMASPMAVRSADAWRASARRLRL